MARCCLCVRRAVDANSEHQSQSAAIRSFCCCCSCFVSSASISLLSPRARCGSIPIQSSACSDAKPKKIAAFVHFIHICTNIVSFFVFFSFSLRCVVCDYSDALRGAQKMHFKNRKKPNKYLKKYKKRYMVRRGEQTVTGNELKEKWERHQTCDGPNRCAVCCAEWMCARVCVCSVNDFVYFVFWCVMLDGYLAI